MQSSQQLIHIIGSHHKYQIIISLLLTLTGLCNDFAILFLSFMVSPPIVTYLDTKTDKIINTQLNQTICENEIYEINTEKTKFNWATEFKLTCDPLPSTILSSSYVIGCLIGLCFLRFVFHKKSKEKVIKLIISIYCIATTLVFFKEYYTTVLMTLIHGFCHSSTLVLRTSIITELTDNNHRSYFITSQIFSGVVACIITPYMYHSQINWLYFYGGVIIYNSIILTLISIIVTDSPVYLIISGNKEQTIKSSIYIARINGFIIENDCLQNNLNAKNSIINCNKENDTGTDKTNIDTILKDNPNEDTRNKLIQNMNDTKYNILDLTDWINKTFFSKVARAIFDSDKDIEDLKESDINESFQVPIKVHKKESNTYFNKQKESFNQESQEINNFNNNEIDKALPTDNTALNMTNNSNKCNSNENYDKKKDLNRSINSLASNNSSNPNSTLNKYPKTKCSNNSVFYLRISNQKNSFFQPTNYQQPEYDSIYSVENPSEIPTSFSEVENADKLDEENYIKRSLIKQKHKYFTKSEMKNFIYISFLVIVCNMTLFSTLYEIKHYTNEDNFDFLFSIANLLGSGLFVILSYISNVSFIGRKGASFILLSVALLLRMLFFLLNYSNFKIYLAIRVIVDSNQMPVHTLLSESFSNKNRVHMFSSLFIVKQLITSGIPFALNYLSETAFNIFFCALLTLGIIFLFFSKETNKKKIRDV